MTEPESPESSFDIRVVNTEYGPLRVEAWLLLLWSVYGWPADEVLRRMVADQPFGPMDVAEGATS